MSDQILTDVKNVLEPLPTEHAQRAGPDRTAPLSPPHGVASNQSDGALEVLDDVNTRDELRRTVVLPLTAMFVRSDGMVLNETRAGFSKNLSPSGTAFELSGTESLASSTVLLGIDLPGIGTRFAGVTNGHIETCKVGLRCGGEFAGVAHTMLQQESRIPILNNDRYRFEMRFSEEIYQSWENAGVLKRTVLDRILLCPKCDSVPTFRFACRSCGAGRLTHELLIHHYACAYVGPADDFSTDSPRSLACPKCRTRHLAVGTDFEYAPGEFHCHGCGWHDRDLEQTGHCLSCEHRFPIHQSVEEELIGYDVERLDPLAVLQNLG